jgi:hypothetical protein
VVSAYFSHLYSHPLFGKLEEHRERLRSVPIDEGLMLELESRKYQFRMMLEWNYHRPEVLELRMEDVTTNAAEEVPRIMAHLGLGRADGLTRKRLARIVASHDFTALAGRPVGEEDVTSHYRKGVAGDWATHFTSEHIEYFKAHYGELLLLLGYEKSNDWG